MGNPGEAKGIGWAQVLSYPRKNVFQASATLCFILLRFTVANLQCSRVDETWTLLWDQVVS
jgi:hypothetical protein